uniref:Uncharacterized protein n=1 Tax=Arundo donax TaxID=35708 RepID=A0A0A9NLC4_ARUDO
MDEPAICAVVIKLRWCR